jgi:hypothetical protein
VRSRSTARQPRPARARARRAAIAALLGVAALLGGGTASALAGPGVVLKQGGANPKTVSGSQIAGSADTGGTYTIRDQPDDKPSSISLRGVSIRGLLALAGFNPGAVSHVSVVGADGPLITLTGPDINNPSFPQGPALVSDSGGVTRFLRPAREAGGTTALVTSAPGTPLEMQVDGGGLLAVEVTASTTTAKVGQSITFTARVRFAPPGASFTYNWNFDDGTSGTGRVVSHAYSYSSDFQPLVQVDGVGGSQCTPQCGGPGKVRVVVTGAKRRPGQTAGTPQGGGPGGTGTGGTGTGSGSGNGTGGSGAGGSGQGAAARKPPPLRAERPEPHSRFSSNPQSGAGKTIVQGVLLAGQGSTIEGSLPGGSPSGSPKPRQGVRGTVDKPSQILASLALALAIVMLGALRERRSVRLRVA